MNGFEKKLYTAKTIPKKIKSIVIRATCSANSETLTSNISPIVKALIKLTIGRPTNSVINNFTVVLLFPYLFIRSIKINKKAGANKLIRKKVPVEKSAVSVLLDLFHKSFFAQFQVTLLHKDLKCKAPLIEPNLRRNLGKWST
ncbi:hypothetical protein [Acinetobacter sp. YH16052]|uniref:hypothetical protein n=1 Tax=Acinetobacter sp. YH16052 TaxID=2601191 RepID=UPI0015D10144|nr:hypothetical protein [Acinetobacter sp. YH16052]